VGAALVGLEDCHVGGGEGDVEGEEDGCDGDVGGGGGGTAYCCGVGGVGWLFGGRVSFVVATLIDRSVVDLRLPCWRIDAVFDWFD
jgi:hypothetical protein